MPGQRGQPIPAWFWMLAAVAAVVIVAFVVTTSLLAIAGHATPGTDQANARLDAVRTESQPPQHRAGQL